MDMRIRAKPGPLTGEVARLRALCLEGAAALAKLEAEKADLLAVCKAGPAVSLALKDYGPTSEQFADALSGMLQLARAAIAKAERDGSKWIVLGKFLKSGNAAVSWAATPSSIGTVATTDLSSDYTLMGGSTGRVALMEEVMDVGVPAAGVYELSGQVECDNDVVFFLVETPGDPPTNLWSHCHCAAGKSSSMGPVRVAFSGAQHVRLAVIGLAGDIVPGGATDGGRNTYVTLVGPLVEA